MGNFVRHSYITNKLCINLCHNFYVAVLPQGKMTIAERWLLFQNFSELKYSVTAKRH